MRPKVYRLNSIPFCLTEGCGKKSKAKGLCSTHYTQAIYRQRPDVRQKARKAFRTVRSRYMRARLSAKRRGLSWTLSDEQFERVASKPCYYCGTPAAETTGVGLDRIDNFMGYEPDNVIPACVTCNSVRGAMFSVEETKLMIEAVLEYRKIRKSENDFWGLSSLDISRKLARRTLDRELLRP